MFFILLLVIAGFFIWAVTYYNGKPTISVDYAAKYYEYAKGGDYDPNEDARPFYEQAFAKIEYLPESVSCFRGDWPGDMNEAEISDLKEIILKNEEGLEILKQAIEKKFYVNTDVKDSNGFLYVFDERMPNFRQTAYSLKWKGKWEAYNGNVHDGLEYILLCNEMSKHLTGKTTLVDKLVATALSALGYAEVFTVLDRVEVVSSDLKTIHIYYEGQRWDNEDMDMFIEEMRAKNLIENIFTDNGKGNGRIIPGQYIKYYSVVGAMRGRWDPSTLEEYVEYIKNYSKLMLRLYRHDDRKMTIDKIERGYDELSRLYDVSPWEANERGTSFENKILAIARKNIFVLEELGYMHKFIELQWRRECNRLGLVNTLVVLRYKADKGKLPASLDELVSEGYLKETLRDPYGPGSFVYIKGGDDFVLYSRGKNLVDDGGERGSRKMWSDDGDWVFWPVIKKER